jgi:hypothetical protein
VVRGSVVRGRLKISKVAVVRINTSSSVTIRIGSFELNMKNDQCQIPYRIIIWNNL